MQSPIAAKTEFLTVKLCIGACLILLAVLFLSAVSAPPEDSLSSLSVPISPSNTLAEVDSAAAAEAEVAKKPLVYTFTIADNIMAPAWRIWRNAMDEAEEIGADVILLKLDTYGGRVDLADSMSQSLLNTEATTIVYILNNAASAGALISISCDSIYMAESAQIGAATVVSGGTGEAMPDKYQAYMRAKMRSIAEKQGRNPDIAEAMVDQDLEVPGIIEAGKTLVFTPEEAIENGFCEGKVNSAQEALEAAGIMEAEIVAYAPTTLDRWVGFFSSQVVSGLLLTLIFVGIYMELQTPGVGFPLLVAATAAVLYFAPLYLDGLAANWEIMLFVIGVLLLGIEMFVLPGFGIAGVAGIGVMVVSLTLSMVGNDNFNFTFTAGSEIAVSFLTVMAGLVLSFGTIYLFMSQLSNNRMFNRFVLEETQQSSEGWTVDAYEEKGLSGSMGLAVSDLRPSGKVDIGEERFDAMTEGGYIEKGDEVTVIDVRGNHLLVRKA